MTEPLSDFMEALERLRYTTRRFTPDRLDVRVRAVYVGDEPLRLMGHQVPVEDIEHLTKRCATCHHLGDQHTSREFCADETFVGYMVWAPYCREHTCPCAVFVFPNGEPVTEIAASGEEGTTA